MRAVLGLIGLVVTLIVAGVLVKTQLKAVQADRTASAGPASMPPGAIPASPRQVSRQVADDIARAMQQGAPRSDGNTPRDAEK